MKLFRRVNIVFNCMRLQFIESILETIKLLLLSGCKVIIKELQTTILRLLKTK